MKIPQRGRRTTLTLGNGQANRSSAGVSQKQPDFAAGGARYRSGVLRARALDTRCNPLHFVFAVELQLFQLDFFEEVFRTEVGFFEDALQLRFVLLMLL